MKGKVPSIPFTEKDDKKEIKKRRKENYHSN